MQPLTIEIEGSYYDSYLSKNRFLLFTPDGDVRAYAWDRLIATLCKQSADQIIPELLYGMEGQTASALFHDARVRAAALDRISEATSITLRITERDLADALLKEQQFPCEFPYAAFDIYERNAYVAGPSGISAVASYPSLKRIFSSKGSKELFDLPCFWMTTGWGEIVASAGEEGLWEISPPSVYSPSASPRLISRNCTMFHGWLGASLYASSPHPGEGILIEYAFKERFEPLRIRKESEVLGAVEASWGGASRICGLTSTGVRIIEVSFGDDDEVENRSGLVLSEPVDYDIELDGRFVGAANSFFGTIIETDNQFILIDRDGEVLVQKTAPVSWRIYPRSKSFRSFLGVAFEDRLLQMVFPDALLPDNRPQQRRLFEGHARRTRAA